MVANETGLTDLTLENIWNVYDTLFCEVSPLRSATTVLLQSCRPRRHSAWLPVPLWGGGGPGKPPASCETRELPSRVEKNPRAGNRLLVVSSSCPSPPRTRVVSDAILLSHAFCAPASFPVPRSLNAVRHVSWFQSLCLSSPSPHTHRHLLTGEETPLERLRPGPGELTCPLRYAENTRAGPATLGLTPSHAADEPAEGVQLPLPVRDLRAGREGPASGG